MDSTLPQTVTMEALTRRLEQEPAFEGLEKERCRAYARMVKLLEKMTSRSSDGDYARFANGACRPFPAAALLAGGS